MFNMLTGKAVLFYLIEAALGFANQELGKYKP